MPDAAGAPASAPPVARRRLLTGAGGLGVLLGLAASAREHDGPPTPQQASSRVASGPAAGIGVTIDSFGSYDPAGGDLDAILGDLDAVAALGGTWARTNLSAGHLVDSWGAEGEPVRLREGAVAQLHAVLDRAERLGISMCLMYINHYPDAEAPAATWIDRTAAWWDAASAEFAPRIAMAQIFNEASATHYRFHSGIDRADLRTYREELAALLLRAREVIHRHHPGVLITTNLYGWPVGDEVEEDWIRALDQLAAVQDVLTLDAYVDWDDEGAEDLNGLLERLAGLRERYGRHVAIGEIGVSTYGLAESVQADRIETVVRTVKDAVPAVYATFLYQLRDWTADGDHEESFGLMHADGTPKEAYRRLERIGLG